jgi:hypothetical protein
MKRPTWPDGTPKSIANSFSAHKTGAPSIFATDTQFKLHTGRFKTTQRAVLADRHGGTYSKAGPL